MNKNKNDFLRIIISSISNHLEKSNVIPQDNFLDIGGDSLSAMKIKIDIENKLHVVVPLEEIMLTDSIADLLEYVRKRGEFNE